MGPRADSSAEGEIRAASSPRWQDPSGIVIAAAFASERAPVLEDGATPPAGPRAAVEGEGDTPTTRVAESVRSLKLGASDGQESPGSKGSPGSVGASVFRSLLRGGGSGERQRMSRSDSGAQPTCLICLEPLTSEDFLVSQAALLTFIVGTALRACCPFHSDRNLCWATLRWELQTAFVKQLRITLGRDSQSLCQY